MKFEDYQDIILKGLEDTRVNIQKIDIRKHSLLSDTAPAYATEKSNNGWGFGKLLDIFDPNMKGIVYIEQEKANSLTKILGNLFSNEDFTEEDINKFKELIKVQSGKVFVLNSWISRVKDGKTVLSSKEFSKFNLLFRILLDTVTHVSFRRPV